jgi:hypothetical protein
MHSIIKGRFPMKRNADTLHDNRNKTDLYVVHPRCVYAVDGGVVPSNTTELSSVLYWFCDAMFRPRKAIFRSISIYRRE